MIVRLIASYNEYPFKALVHFNGPGSAYRVQYFKHSVLLADMTSFHDELEEAMSTAGVWVIEQSKKEMV